MRLIFDASAASVIYKDDGLYLDINGNQAESTYYDQRSSSEDDERSITSEDCDEAQENIEQARGKSKSSRLFRRRGSDELVRPMPSPEILRRPRAFSSIPQLPSKGIRTMSDPALERACQRNSLKPGSPLSSPPSPDSDIDFFDSSSLCGSPVCSPRTRRKTIDITKSAAYKEIYADKLRLYSLVLSKHMADSGEVGRQMNELRKARSKNNALKTDKPSSSNTLRPPGRFRRSQSANCVLLQQQIAEWRSATELSPQIERRNTISEVDGSMVRSRSMSLLQECAIAETPSETNLLKASRGSCSDLRMQAAAERIQERRRKLESFDITLDKTNLFLQKMRQQSFAPAS